ncbi:MAG: hypothetical protein IJI41_10810 [Anaerolineaceae bacterium]|nr:hypothetical protein [Anaerolineaceae bacterium]
MNIRLINDSDWEKNFNLDKSIIRIGSQVSCDIQIRDPNVQPLLMQITRSGGADAQYSMRFFAKNIMISRGEQVTPAEQMRPYNVLDGDSISFGIYRMNISLGDDKIRVRTSRHMSAEMFFSSRELSPDSPINGIVELKNLGTEKPCQFRMNIKGIPEACLQSSPLPYLYPGASSSVGFIISHLHTKPAPGFQRVIITISAPDDYFGETLEFNQDVYVYPVFDNDYVLDDDSEDLSGFNADQKRQKQVEEVKKPMVLSVQDGNLLGMDHNTENTDRVDPATKVRFVGSGDNANDPFAEPAEEDENKPYVRRKKQEPVVVIRHEDEDAFEAGKSVDESTMVPEETVKPKKMTSGRVKKSEVLTEIAEEQAEKKDSDVFSESKSEAEPEPVKKQKKADVPRLADVQVISAENKAFFDENERETAVNEGQESAASAVEEPEPENSQTASSEEIPEGEPQNKIEQAERSGEGAITTAEDTAAVNDAHAAGDEASAPKIGDLTLETNEGEVSSENNDKYETADDLQSGFDVSDGMLSKAEAEERTVELDPAFDQLDEQPEETEPAEKAAAEVPASAGPVVWVSKPEMEETPAEQESGNTEPVEQNAEAEAAENLTEGTSEPTKPVEVISETEGEKRPEEQEPEKDNRNRKSSGRKKKASQNPPAGEESALPSEKTEQPSETGKDLPEEASVPKTKKRKKGHGDDDVPAMDKVLKVSKSKEPAPGWDEERGEESISTKPDPEAEMLREKHPNFVIRKGGSFDESSDASPEIEPAAEPEKKPAILVMKGGAFDE